MNKIINIMIAITAVLILAGCVSSTKEFARRTTSTRTDVFVEGPAEGNSPAGFVDLVIKASIKNPLKSGSAPGANGYPFLLNIDGQAVLWTVDGQEETSPLYKNGSANRDPDAGVGLLYRLEKKIRLAAGPHKIVFGLPNKDYISEFKVSLSESAAQVLEFKPRYRYKSKIDHIPTFLKGLDRYEAVLNGQNIHAVVVDYSLYAFTAFLPVF